jgi:hypothetical protein
MINRLPTEQSTETQRSAPSRTEGNSPATGDWRQWTLPVEQFIAKNPGACLASAFVAGAVVAWWIKRR